MDIYELLGTACGLVLVWHTLRVLKKAAHEDW